MTKTKAPEAPIPTDVPTLSRWIGVQPAANLKRLQTWITKLGDDELARVEEGLRCALQWAWDEQPELVGRGLNPWLKSPSERLRKLAVGALPLSHEDHREAALRNLKKMILDKSKEVRLAAWDLLLEDPVAQLDSLKKAAAAEEPAVRALAARHLAAVDAETFKRSLALVEALALDPDPEVHGVMAQSMADLWERDSRSVLEVGRKMAVSELESHRTAVAAGCFEIVLADAFDQLLPTLRVWLKAPEVWLRWTLVRSLRFVRVSPRSLTLFKALFEDKEPEIRRRVAILLVDLFDAQAESGRAVSELLRRAKVDPSKRVREIVEEGEQRHQVDFDKIPAPGEALGELPEEPEGVEEGEPGEADEETEAEDDDD